MSLSGQGLALTHSLTSSSIPVDRGVHPAFANLFDRYPLRSRRLFARLRALCSRLAHWAPILAEVQHLL